MIEKWNGIYAAYMSGKEGQGYAMLVFFNGIISGIDPLGVRFDGKFKTDKENKLVGEVNVTVPPDGTVIQGVSSGPSGLNYVVPIEFDYSDIEKPFVSLSTPLGPINLKLERLREV